MMIFNLYKWCEILDYVDRKYVMPAFSNKKRHDMTALTGEFTEGEDSDLEGSDNEDWEDESDPESILPGPQ